MISLHCFTALFHSRKTTMSNPTTVSLREERWQRLLDTFPSSSSLYILDRSGRCLESRIPDPSQPPIAAERVIGSTLEELLSADLIKERKDLFELALRTGKTQRCSHPHPITSDRRIDCMITPICGAGGQIEEVLIQEVLVSTPVNSTTQR